MEPLCDSGSKGSEGKVSPLRAMSIYAAYRRQRCRWQRKPYNLASLDGNAPLFPYGDFHLKVKRLTMICASLSLLQIMFAVHPGGGSFLSASLSANLSHSLYSAARISPSGGDAAEGGRRGAFSSRRRRGCMVFPRAKPGFKGFLQICARRAPPSPFEPSAPSEPFEPGPRSGPPTSSPPSSFLRSRLPPGEL